jgi:hypothetical protein
MFRGIKSEIKPAHNMGFGKSGADGRPIGFLFVSS